MVLSAMWNLPFDLLSLASTRLASTGLASSGTSSLQPGESSVLLFTVLSAGLAIAIGQSIILFINRVKPGRFVVSLLIQSILFAFGFFFISASTGFISRTFFSTDLAYSDVTHAIGLGYSPLKWAFLAALPYVGEPIFLVLSLMSFFAILGNFSVVADLSTVQAFWCVVWGWFFLRVLQQTVGHPLTILGERLLHWAAGQKLVRDTPALAKLVTAGPAKRLSTASSPERMQSTAPVSRTTTTHKSTNVLAVSSQETSTPASTVAAPAQTSRLNQQPSWMNSRKTRTLGLLSLMVTTCVAVVMLANFQKLVGLTLILFIAAALLAPLEALGWWAGWFGDRIDTTQNPGVLQEDIPAQPASRYVVYLDGIGQSKYEYQPSVAQFLKSLAAKLPDDIVLISGFMPYSILNLPLDQDRILGFFWRWVERRQQQNPESKLGALVNVQNVLTVAVAADQRYGPLYNQGMAQLIYNSLIQYGYQPGSGTPVSLIGYSGGGEMSMGALPFLKQALNTSIEVISLGGVISGNIKAIALEHLYHLVGEKDMIERVGPTLFPRRWKLFFLSYWNRAKRRGQISLISLGPVGHQVPGGIMDAHHILPDGRSSLQQTLDLVSGILTGQLRLSPNTQAPPSNYQRYIASDYNQPRFYPLDQGVDLEQYRPIAPWMGRLILPAPEQRSVVKGVLFEVHHAEAAYQHLVGQVVYLRWCDRPEIQSYIRSVTRDVHFSDDAEYTSRAKGLIHPTRLNHWRQVDPLESLAGARPQDDMLVMLAGTVNIVSDPVAESVFPVIQIEREPVQISGRYYGLVKILGPVDEQPTSQVPTTFRVIHFNRQSQQFDGPEEIVHLPEVVPDNNGTQAATNRDIEKSPLNPTGWYIYGAKNAMGVFVVQALAPRALFQLQPTAVISDPKGALAYLKKETWDNLDSQKGSVQSVLASPNSPNADRALQKWQLGDRALLLHVYGGIGGKNTEPAAQSPIYFGHFSYGQATVIREPLTGELRFEIEYYQVYTHNVRGMTSGTMHWSKYMGDRQWGFLGTRPVCDLLVKQDAFTRDFDFDGTSDSALRGTIAQLQAMMARYRIGDGTAGTYVGPANNCAQDSNQALYAALQNMENLFSTHHEWLENWQRHDPAQAERFQQLLTLKKTLKRELMPFGSARADWQKGLESLGSCLEDRPLYNLSIGLASWRTLLPRLASNTIAKIFLEQGADIWILRTNQVGGHDPDIVPLAPMSL